MMYVILIIAPSELDDTFIDDNFLTNCIEDVLINKSFMSSKSYLNSICIVQLIAVLYTFFLLFKKEHQLT